MLEELRLGGIIDDYCTKCQAVMNHSIVSMVDGAPARTECRTCYSSHKFRNSKGSKKKPGNKQDLFNEVLEKMGPIGPR